MKNEKEDQGEKQIGAIQNQGEITAIKKYTYGNQDSSLVSKQREMFNKLVDERLEEITKLDKKVNPDDLIYRYKDSTANGKFNEFDHAFNILDKIRGRKIILADVKEHQAEFKSNLREVKKVNKRHWLN